MILLDMRDYIKERKTVPLPDLARRFDIPESAIQSMVEHWIRKGCVVAQKPIGIVSAAGCGNDSGGSGCAHCVAAGCVSQSIVYRWKAEQ